jgi:hypothetical protein
VPETLVNELESAIADVGALVVCVQKYRHGLGPEGNALARRALALGDAARRLHRRGALEETEARRLLEDAHELARQLAALQAAVREAAEYRAAREAYRQGDNAVLARALPVIFADLEAVPSPPDLFHALSAFRRGRLRPVAELVAEVVAAREEGLAAEGDDLSPGADADLPAVTFHAEPPPDEPLLLRLPTPTAPAPVHRLADGDTYLIHAARVRAPFAVEIGTLPDDEQLRVELAPDDWERYRDELAVAFRRAEVPAGRRA